MASIKKILFPTDFSSCSASSRQHAVFLAKKHNARIHVMHVVAHFENAMAEIYPMQGGANAAMPLDLFDKIAKSATAEIMKIFSEEGISDVDIDPVVVPGGSPARAILGYAAEQKVDLIVMGTHGHTGLSHLFLGSIAERVVRLADCPVLTVREQSKPYSLDKVSKILVPTDFSEDSRRAYGFAVELAETSGSQIFVIHVIDPSPFPKLHLKEEGTTIEIIPGYESRSKKALAEWLGQTGNKKMPVDSFITVGKPAAAVSEFARKKNIDLVVVAAHGESSLKEFFLGSTAEKIVRQASCPVWTVRTAIENGPKTTEEK